MKTVWGKDWMTADLAAWLKQRHRSESLVLTATCCCDVSRMGAELCDYLNQREQGRGASWVAIDAEDVRRLAGDAFWRSMIFSAAPDKAGSDRFRTDFERVARGIASLGGAVLSGQACFEATQGLENAFRFMVSVHDPHGEDDPVAWLDPESADCGNLARSIGDTFIEWIAARTTAIPGGIGRR